MRRVVHLDDARAHAAHALMNGASAKAGTSVGWEVAGNCEDPLVVSLEGRPEGARPLPEYDGALVAQDGKVYFADVAPRRTFLAVDFTVRCRRCPSCLRFRANLWRDRARGEIHAAPRTWFGTMTLRPEEHVRMSYAADAELRSRGTRWAELSPVERLQAEHRQISGEITKYLKRIRKESGARLRYCLVVEAHKSGLPHYHILIHERWLAGSVGERTLRKQWKLGHSKFNLVADAGAAWYVAKYLAKSSLARVRASARYGQNAL